MPSGAEPKIREAMDIALKHQREGRLRAAGNIYRRVLRVEPENPDALHFLGVIAHKIGRPDLAIELLERSIAADPGRIGFRLNLGSLYLKRQQVDEAIACYRNAIALEPASASAHAHLAAALARQGKLEEANDAFDRATELKTMPQATASPVGTPALASDPVETEGEADSESAQSLSDQSIDRHKHDGLKPSSHFQGSTEGGEAGTPCNPPQEYPEREQEDQSQSEGLSPSLQPATGVGSELAFEPPFALETEPESPASYLTEHDSDAAVSGFAPGAGVVLQTEGPSVSLIEAEEAGLFPEPSPFMAHEPPDSVEPGDDLYFELATDEPEAEATDPPWGAEADVMPRPAPAEPDAVAASPADPIAGADASASFEFSIPPLEEARSAEPVEFVIPIEPPGMHSAEHAAKAGLALQYAWALHFAPAHAIPPPIGGIFGVDDEEPTDPALFALPEAGSASICDEPQPSEGESFRAVEPLAQAGGSPNAAAPLEDAQESYELDDDMPLVDSLVPLSLASEPVEAAEAALQEPRVEASEAESQVEDPAADALEPPASAGLVPAEAPAGTEPADVVDDLGGRADAPSKGSADQGPVGAVCVLDAPAADLHAVSAVMAAPHQSALLVEIDVRPGLLGEAHAEILEDRFDSPGDGKAGPASQAIDRSAETLPMPGVPGLRSFRDGAGTPAAGRNRPPSAESLRRRGVALIGFRRLDEAIHLLNRAISLRPRFAEAHRDLGGAMLRQGNLEGAIASLQRALQLRPTFAEAWGSLGDAYQLEGKIGQAIRCYRRLLEIVPRAAKVHSNMLLSMNYDPRFSAEEIFREHLRWAEQHGERHAHEIRPHANDRTPGRRLMIGYVSPDFRRHSVNYFAEPVLASHYRPDFHVTCYSDVIRPDGVTRGLAEICDDFRDTHAMNDEQLAARVRADGIDILVDLSGHTGNNRLGTFARKPAPVQVTYLGYPNTTGLATMDYRVTDALADPPGQTERLHSEQLVRLPETFLCYQPPPASPDVGSLPCLKSGHVTFGCFNILAKITDEVMALWARILQELPNSRLVLKGRGSALSNESRRRHVRGIFVNHGISPDRLELLGKEPNYARHLAHYGRLDIVLDPFPYNGTTTTCEALWMGLPVVTLAGDRHASRVGVSILTNIGLPDLIAGTPEQYVRIATNLADSPKDLAKLRSTLRERMLRSPLTDSIRLTRALEAEYHHIWARWCEAEQSAGAARDPLTLTDQ